MQNIDLRIETAKVSDLVPYAGNAKEHPAHQVEQIANSIEQFGNCDPIAVWTNSDGEQEIVEGHGRLMALQRLGIEECPVIHLDHLTDEQRRAYVHVHNQTTLNSGFDLEALQAEISQLPEFDWDALGFGEIDGLETSEAPEDVEFEDTEAPTDAPTRCKRGDVWIMGEHRLVCGDSTDAEAFERLMNGEKADMLLTDPPYNVAYTGKTAEELTIENDKFETAEAFMEFLTDVFGNAVESMKPGAAFYVWYASWFSAELFAAAKAANMTVRQVIVWNKSAFALGRQDYQWKHELCLYGWKDGAAHYFVNDRTLSTVWDSPEWEPSKASKAELVEFAESAKAALHADVWDFKKTSSNEDHPTMKPVPLMGRSIMNSTRRGGVVLDPFGGSGSTLIACEQSGRRCRTIELDPHYCDVIIKRWEEETGLQAVREDG